MDDLKRLVIPAIAAIVLHGFLISFKLPKQETLKPVLKGNPIKIEVNVFAPKTIVPEKKEERKITEIIPDPITPKPAVQKKVIAQPVIIPKQQKKILIEPERIKKEVVIEDKNKDIDTQYKQVENQAKIIDESPPQPIVEKGIEKNSTAIAHTEKIADEIEVDQPEKKNSITPIQKRAIPIYRRNKQPPYPAMAKRRGYEGKIVLSVLVDSKGMVSELKIKHSSEHLSLDRAALKTVKTWLFVPATEDGTPVAMWVDVPIEFQLM